jgi:hypothetical protein
MKSIVAGLGLAACLLAGSPAEARYGFRCSITEIVTVYPGDGMSWPSITKPPQVRVFVIEADKGVSRERFLGSDGPATPFTITHKSQGNRLEFDKPSGVYLWISGEFTGLYGGIWTENPTLNPGFKWIHVPEGHCDETMDIPDVDLPAKSVALKAQELLESVTPK